MKAKQQHIHFLYEINGNLLYYIWYVMTGELFVLIHLY